MRLSLYALCLSLLLLGCEESPQERAVMPTLAPADTKGADVDMVLIPAGSFIMGSNKEDEEGLLERFGFVRPLYRDEHPQHSRTLPDYYIDTYEVSNRQYKQFVDATGHPVPPTWIQTAYNVTLGKLAQFSETKLREIALDYFQLDRDTRKMSKQQLLDAMAERFKQQDQLPVTSVTWFDADSYCRWRGARLPSEAEWEKAARGAAGQEFPWGDVWDPDITNMGENVMAEEGVVAVGSFPNNASPYGVYDMSGNVWEWTHDWYEAYPDSPFSSLEYGEKFKVARGGGGGIGHYSLSVFFRAALRSPMEPNSLGDDAGFRCVQDLR